MGEGHCPLRPRGRGGGRLDRLSPCGRPRLRPRPRAPWARRSGQGRAPRRLRRPYLGGARLRVCTRPRTAGRPQSYRKRPLASSAAGLSSALGRRGGPGRHGAGTRVMSRARYGRRPASLSAPPPRGRGTRGRDPGRGSSLPVLRTFFGFLLRPPPAPPRPPAAGLLG